MNTAGEFMSVMNLIRLLTICYIVSFGLYLILDALGLSRLANLGCFVFIILPVVVAISLQSSFDKQHENQIYVDTGEVVLRVDPNKDIVVFKSFGWNQTSPKLDDTVFIDWPLNFGGKIELYQEKEINGPNTLILAERSNMTLMTIVDLDLIDLKIAKVYNDFGCVNTECFLEIIRQKIKLTKKNTGSCKQIEEVFKQYSRYGVKFSNVNYCW